MGQLLGNLVNGMSDGHCRLPALLHIRQVQDYSGAATKAIP